MLINRMRMSNFKCFEDEDTSFSEGVTVIHGVNGSGKSSLLDAVYFTLYGSDSLASDDNLATPITNGEEHMKVDLWFTHNGNEYHVNREIRERNSGVAHNASIEGPDVQRDGPTDTDEFIVDLFNMDASSFTNCSYVRQEDASKLIEASASDRKDMIDELLQIGVLKTTGNAHTARSSLRATFTIRKRALWMTWKTRSKKRRMEIRTAVGRREGFNR